MAQHDLILVGDLGGTNTTLALVDTSGQTPRVLRKSRFCTQDIETFPAILNDYLATLSTQGLPSRGCFAIAGPVHNNAGKLTHASFGVDAKELTEQTSLEEALVINDFDAVSLSISTLQADEIVQIKKGSATPKGRITVIGAGTGLGKSLLVWDDLHKAYLPIPSETGHADMVIRSQEELEFTSYTLNRLNAKGPPSWELALSGRGLVNIYEYLSSKRGKEGHAKPAMENITPESIGANRKTDPLCEETFRWFERFYARCAKNAVLDYVATGGVYLAGGIIARNPDLCGQGFIDEFTDNLRLRDILEKAPVWGIRNYDVSLIGCANAMRVLKDRAVKKK